MYFYKFFSLQFASEIIFPDLAEENTSDIDVTIRYGLVDHDSRNEAGASIKGHCFDFFDFHIEKGSIITIRVRRNDVSEKFIAQVIQGELMSALLRQRGLLTLHACAVVKDSFAVGFVGDSGWGKSTLAEYYCQNGYSLLSDDVLAIDTEHTPPIALPSYPEIKLRSEAVGYLREGTDLLRIIEPNDSRRISDRHNSRCAVPTSLRALYILQPNYGDNVDIESMRGQEKLLDLICHTRSSNIVKEPRLMQLHLRQIASLCKKVPVCRLHRKKSIAALPEIFAKTANFDLNRL